MRTAPRAAAQTAFVALALLALAAPPRAAAEPDVEVVTDLQPRVLGVGDFAFFSIEVRGGVFSRVRFEPDFELTNFEPPGNPSTTSGVQWINGVSTRSLRYTWRLQAREIGLAAVRSITVRVGDQRFDLPAEEARVVADPPASARRRPSLPGGAPNWHLSDPLEDLLQRRRELEGENEAEVRLVAEVTPSRPWVGEQVTYTLWLYTQTNIARITPNELPQFEGFWVEEVPRPEQQTTELAELDGERFYRTALVRRALFPLNPGEAVIEPAEMSLVARVVPSPFFRTLGARVQPMTVRSEPLRVSVRALPPPPPEYAGRFTGLVGDLGLAARLVPSELAVGEAATLELSLEGRGNVEGQATPRLDLPPAVRALPAAEEGGNRIEGSTVEAKRTWSYPLVPDRPGTWRLPPIEVVYFDPKAGEYRRAEAPPLVLRARRGESEATLAGGPALHPIKNAALPTPEARRPDLAAVLPWFFAGPWALVLVVALVARRRAAVGDPVLDRFDQRLNGAAAGDRPRQVAIAVEAAWAELLAERRGVDPASPPSRWLERLAAAGVDEATRRELGELIDDLHYLRNAPQLSTTAELSGALVERSRRLGRRLAG